MKSLSVGLPRKQDLTSVGNVANQTHATSYVTFVSPRLHHVEMCPVSGEMSVASVHI
jgi:hypothetical protein